MLGFCDWCGIDNIYECRGAVTAFIMVGGILLSCFIAAIICSRSNK